MITIYTTEFSPLDADREVGVFSRLHESGVISGAEVSAGTGFNITLKGGTFIINGVVAYDDATYTDWKNLDTVEPYAGSPRSYLVYAKFDPDTDDTLQYGILSASGGSPPTLADLGGDEQYAVQISFISLLGSEADATEARIINFDLVGTESVNTIMTCDAVHYEQSASGTVLQWKNMRVYNYNDPRMDVRGNGSTTDMGPFGIQYDEEFTSAADLDRGYFFIRYGDGQGDKDLQFLPLETSGGVPGNYADVILGDGANNTGDSYPNRPDRGDIIVLGVLQEDHIFWANGMVTENGGHSSGPMNSHQANHLKSTAYSSGNIAPDTEGVIDLDGVISNISDLRVMGLDKAYDSVEPGSSQGSGRTINVDSDTIEILHKALVDSLPHSKWQTPFSIHMDADESGEGANTEKGIDVYSLESENKRAGLAVRRPYNYASIYEMKSIPADLDYVSGEVRVDFTDPGSPAASGWWTEHKEDRDYADSKFVTISAGLPVGSDGFDKVYRLKVDEVGGTYRLVTTDGVVDIPAGYPDDFGDMASTISVTLTVWEIYIELSDETVLNDAEVRNNFKVLGTSTLDDTTVNGTLDTQGDVNINGTFTSNSDISINGWLYTNYLDVTDDASIGGMLTAKDANFTGTVDFNVMKSNRIIPEDEYLYVSNITNVDYPTTTYSPVWALNTIFCRGVLKFETGVWSIDTAAATPFQIDSVNSSTASEVTVTISTTTVPVTSEINNKVAIAQPITHHQSCRVSDVTSGGGTIWEFTIYIKEMVEDAGNTNALTWQDPSDGCKIGFIVA